MAESNPYGHGAAQGETRWVWDLYPLRPRSGGNQECPAEAFNPGEIVNISFIRHPRGSITDMDSGQSTKLAARIFHKPYYCPTNSEIALIAEKFPGHDPHRPQWIMIDTDLRLAGHSANDLEEAKAPLILAWLKQSLSQTPRSQRKAPIQNKTLRRRTGHYKSNPHVAAGAAQAAKIEPAQIRTVGFLKLIEFAQANKLTPKDYQRLRKCIERWRQSHEDDCRHIDNATGRTVWHYPVAKLEDVLVGMRRVPKRP